MRSSVKIGLFGSLLILSVSGYPQEFDFLIQFNNCQAVFAPLRLLDNPVRTAEGDPVVFTCSRNSGSLMCDVSINEGAPSKMVYEIIIDSPPYLVFGAANGSDYVSANTSEHAAVLTTRTVNPDMLISKLCHGMYLTKFELEQSN